MKRNTAALAIKLDVNDEITSILLIENERIGIMSKSGQFIMVTTSNIKPIGRVTRGINVTGTNTKGIKIQKSNTMCDFIPLNSTSDILINSSTTQIRLKYSEIPILSRGAQGTKLIKLTNNYVIGISSL